jgi:hypothetical protein
MAMDQTRFRLRPLTALLIALGVLFIVLAIVYFTTAASSLPSFIPGHQAGLSRHHVTHGVAMVGLAVLAWIGAWFSTAPGKNAGDAT